MGDGVGRGEGWPASKPASQPVSGGVRGLASIPCPYQKGAENARLSDGSGAIVIVGMAGRLELLCPCAPHQISVERTLIHGLQILKIVELQRTLLALRVWCGVVR